MSIDPRPLTGRDSSGRSISGDGTGNSVGGQVPAASGGASTAGSPIGLLLVLTKAS